MDMVWSLLDHPLPWLDRIWSFLTSFGYSHELTSFIAVTVIPMAFFYIYGFTFFLVDMYSSEAFKAKYKVQNGIRITSSQYKEALWVSVRNTLFVSVPYGYLLAYHVYPQVRPVPASLPTVGGFLVQLLVSVAAEEVLFYLSHRLVHSKALYVPIHKFHHTYTAPFGIAAIYAHPLEHLIANVIPLSVGPLLTHAHPIFSMIWTMLALFNTTTVHSGYDLSGFLVFPAPYFHDWHHERFNENYGAGEFMDWFFGTDKQYRVAIAKGEMFVPRASKKTA